MELHLTIRSLKVIGKAMFNNEKVSERMCEFHD
jgi:hypothetical protein